MATSAASGVQTGSQQQLNFLNLLVTQLKNQNPLDPLDSNAMVSQLAQISQVSQMESLNSTFKSVLQTEELKYATALLGKQVSFIPDGDTTEVTGKVTGVEQVDDEVHVLVGERSVDVKKLLSISEAVQTAPSLGDAPLPAGNA
jgi:flagellar basal-body rod modification protein FlgD